MFAAVLFDLDNTLIDRDAAFRSLVEDTFDDPVAQNKIIELDQSGYGNRQALFEQWLQLGGSEFDNSSFGQAIANHISHDNQLLDSLATLSESTPIGILTNGGRVPQLSKWKAARLDTVIPRNRLWISEEIGVSKPNAQAFAYACDGMNVVPEHCLYVGDQLEIDVAGARAAGMNAIHVSRPISSDFFDVHLATGFEN